MVEQARADSAPLVRLADRYAAVFVPLALVIVGAAWAISGSLGSAVAVLCVATPCPLIIAAPVAIVAGMSQAARRGVVIKGGGPLEALARAKVLLFDKTGTLTVGHPTLADVITPPGGDADEVLRLAACLDQVSPHVLAAAIAQAAERRGLSVTLPTDVVETAGVGIRGLVEGRQVSIGKASGVRRVHDVGWIRTARRRADLDGAVTVFVHIDGEPAGILLVHDPIRLDAAKTLRNLRRAGIDRLVMVSGDRWETAEMVGAALGVDQMMAERSPSDKVDAVRLEQRYGPTVMVGDGINDAPALALADVGVAVASRGSTASSETADIVLTVDRLDRLGEAVVIARRSRAIAYQSVIAGMGLSLSAMMVAAAGWLPASFGALLQEAIDIAVIFNALRALISPDSDRLQGAEADLARRFRTEHLSLRADVEEIRAVADAIGVVDTATLLKRCDALHHLLTDEVLAHELAEDRQLYPVIARALGGTDPTGSMSRAHVEIAHGIRRLGRLLEDLDSETVDETDLGELRRLLYGLYALLRLHFAQEEEGYFSLIEDEGEKGALVAR